MANPFYAIRNFFLGEGVPPVTVGTQSGRVSGNNNDTSVNFDSAMQISAVWNAVRLIAETIGSLPFGIYENGKPYAGDLSKVLSQNPNAYQTPVEFWETMALNLAISGNAYAVKQYSGSRLVGLMPLSSTQVETELLNDGSIVHRYTQGNDVKVYASKNVWHIKLFGNGIIGLSPLSYASRSINIAQNADYRVNKIYSNGAKPSGILMLDRTLTDTQRAQIKSNFQELESGSEDRLFVLEAGMQYQQTSMSPQDIELLNSRRFQIEDIGRFFGVPSVLLNQTFGQSTLGSNVYEIIAAFYKLGLRPYLEKIESSVIRWLIPPSKWGSVEARFDFDSLLRADTLSRMQANREAIYSGQLTPNEARELESRGPMEGGDVLYIQGATVPLDQQSVEPLVRQPEPVVEEEKQVKSTGDTMNFHMAPPTVNVTFPEIKTDHHIKVDAPHIEPAEIKIDVNVPESPVVVEAVMPENPVNVEAPVVNVEVQPADVTVVDNHPTRAVQRVERDEDGEIDKTIIDYERD